MKQSTLRRQLVVEREEVMGRNRTVVTRGRIMSRTGQEDVINELRTSGLCGGRECPSEGGSVAEEGGGGSLAGRGGWGQGRVCIYI